eukprot:5267199-Prymnesium_polylepis.2
MRGGLAATWRGVVRRGCRRESCRVFAQSRAWCGGRGRSLEEIAQRREDILELLDVGRCEQRGERAEQRLELRVELLPQVGRQRRRHLKHWLERDARRSREMAAHDVENLGALAQDEREREQHGLELPAELSKLPRL